MEYKIRTWKNSDLECLVKHANNWNVAKNMTDKFPFPYSEKDGKSFIEYAIKGIPTHIFAIDINGQACGGIGIHPQDDIHCKNAELGYWLAETYWGQGIMTKAVKEMVEYGFKTYDINRIFARPFGTNKASQRVLEKAGFVLEARLINVLFKKEEYLDEFIYAVRRPNSK